MKIKMKRGLQGGGRWGGGGDFAVDLNDVLQLHAKLLQAISTQNMLILAKTRVTALVTLFLTLLRSWTSQYSMMSL